MTHNEDRIIERVLSQIDGEEVDRDSGPLAGLPPEEEALAREYTELSGLLPYALDPVSPSAACKAAILAEAGVEEAAAAAPEPLPFRVRRVESSPMRTLKAVAAALGFAALGLGAFSGWLYRENQQQAVALEEVRASMEHSLNREKALLSSQLSAGRLQTLVSTKGARLCHLSPAGRAPLQPAARAVIYFDKQRREYFLTARDLAPCREGSEYRLWFMVDGEPISGQSFHVQEGVPIALGSGGFPPRTTAILVTLEARSGAVRPSQQHILFGDQSEEML